MSDVKLRDQLIADAKLLSDWLFFILSGPIGVLEEAIKEAIYQSIPPDWDDVPPRVVRADPAAEMVVALFLSLPV